MEEFKVELAANPDEYFANFYLGILYIMDRKWEPAIALLEKATQQAAKQSRSLFSSRPGIPGRGQTQGSGRSVAENDRAHPSLGTQRLPGDHGSLPSRTVVDQSRAALRKVRRSCRSLRT